MIVMTYKKPPNPGSDEAIAKGCTCPVLDNNHGNKDGDAFWIDLKCPIHGRLNFDFIPPGDDEDE